MRSRGRISALLAALALGAGSAAAQNSSDLLARGVRATHNLEYDSAAVLLRAALGQTGTAALPDTARPRALMYLGATEFFRDRRDSASAAFRRLLLMAPRYRPDQLIFPPEVSGLFEEVRTGTQAVAVTVSPVTEIRTAGDRLVARLHATSLHLISAWVIRSNGAPVRVLYNGAIGDSLEVLWDGRDSAAVPAEGGSYLLRVASRGSTTRIVRMVEVPLELRAMAADTLRLPPPPADSLLLPERGVTHASPRPLVLGLAGTAAALVLPAFAGSGKDGTGARFVVGAATGIAGIAGFLSARKPQPIPANIAANQERRLAWQRSADQVRAENVVRRQGRRITIQAGPMRVVVTP